MTWWLVVVVVVVACLVFALTVVATVKILTRMTA